MHRNHGVVIVVNSLCCKVGVAILLHWELIMNVVRHTLLIITNHEHVRRHVHG